MQKIILASGSKHRAILLKNAGIRFTQISSTLDERAIEAPLDKTDVLPKDRAEILAEAKALDVSEANSDALVIGCDQILSFEDKILHKAENMEEARRRLLELSGKIHVLHSAISLCKAGKTIWRHSTPCEMKMRDLSPEFVGRYLAAAGEEVLSSVGVYQIEGLGSQLFEKIGGDLFSIVGLPLIPLLQELRNQGAIDG